MDHFKRLHLPTGEPVVVELFDVLVNQFGGESRLVSLQMANGRQYHCHFRRPEAEVTFPGWPKERLPRWPWPGDGLVKELSVDTIWAAVEEQFQRGAIDTAFVPTRSPQETWQGIIGFYEGYPNYPGWEPVRRFLPLVRQIAASPFATKLYASQSHERLVVSTVGTAPEREMVQALMIEPREDSIRVAKYQQSTEILEASCPFAEAWTALQPFFDWLVDSAEPGRCT